ncbi:hypothetical protein MHYP_G00263290 [Metynnis hypsauchen]
MIHDEYLKGNLSLIITDADFSKRGWYSCDCDFNDVCDVHLQIEPLNTTVEMMAGESLILSVDVSDAVDVIFNSADVQQSSIWKDGYQKGNSDGYQKGSEDGYRNGLGIGAGVFGIIAMALGLILGMFAGQQMRLLMDTCIQRIRRENPLDRRRGDPSETWTLTFTSCQLWSLSVMQSCSSALCILILLISTFTAVSESCFSQVKVKLHDSAVLPCYGRCSGWGRWTALSNPDDPVAECNQTSCRSVKEGYLMIHDQYLNGNLSLIITDAVFSQRTWYTCKCESYNICDDSVQTESKSCCFL